MIRFGFIGAGLGFIFMMSLTLLSPFCTLCLAPLLGVGVGWATGWFDQPEKIETSLGRGTIAGAITGLGVVAGQVLATLVNGVLVTNSEQLPALMAELGMSELVLTNPDEYWQATLMVNTFCSLFNLALITGLGALGSVIWFQKSRNNFQSAASS